MSTMTRLRMPPPRPALANRPLALDWARLFVGTISRALLFTVLGMAFWAVLPTIVGWIPTTVMTDSMAPQIRAGDVVIAQPVAPTALRPGQVLLVNDPDHSGRLRLHRFADVTPAGQIITKGDANPFADSTPVRATDVRGIGFLRVPFIGLPIVWIHEGKTALVFASGIGLVLLLALAQSDRHLRRRHSASISGHLGARTGVRTLLPVALPIIAGAGLVVCLVVSGSAGASFAASSGNASNSFDATTYTCLDRTPTNSAYFYYTYNEATGTTASDSSGNARPGTLTSGATRDAGSCAANASPTLTLNGTSGQVTTATLVNGPSVFTVETWFKTTTATGGKLIGFGNSQSGASTQFDRHIYMTNAGKLIFGVYSLTYLTISSPASYNDGAMHHVVGTLSSAGLQLYVDGALVASNSSYKTAEVHTGYWRIGYDTISGWPSAPSSEYFKGTIDNTAVYPTALTAAQIAAEYAKGR